MDDELARFTQELEGLAGGSGGGGEDGQVNSAEAAPKAPKVISKTISAAPQRASASAEPAARAAAPQLHQQPPAPYAASAARPGAWQPGVAPPPPPPQSAPPPPAPRPTEDRNEALRQETQQANAQVYAEHARAMASAAQAVRPVGGAAPADQQGGKTAVKRVAGGEVWEDPTLADWPDNDFRLFVGNLGNDASDALLSTAFSKYPSFQRARVIRDKRTNKPKGYGFISFGEPWDMTKAMREMDNKYVGSRPVKLKKSTWADRNVNSAKQTKWEYHKLKYVKPAASSYDSTAKRYKPSTERPTLR